MSNLKELLLLIVVSHFIWKNPYYSQIKATTVDTDEEGKRTGSISINSYSQNYQCPIGFKLIILPIICQYMLLYIVPCNEEYSNSF